MKTFIKNAKLLNGNDINILIENGIITDISNSEFKVFDNEIDCGNNYIIPGLTNGFFDGNIKDCENLLVQGITNVFVKNEDVSTIKWLIQNKFNIVSVININNEMQLNSKYFDNKIEKIKEIGVKNFAFHLKNPNEIYDEIYEFCVKYAHENNLLLISGASENLENVGEIDNEYKMSPISLLESYGFFDIKCMLVDCVCVDKDDVKNVLVNYPNVTICTRPTCNLKDGYGIAPIYSFVNNKINVVLGGVTSNIFKEMALVKELQCGYLNEDVLTENDVFNMVTKNFEVFNMGSSIEVGSRADLVIIDDDNLLNLTPINVKMTIIAGEIKYLR